MKKIIFLTIVFGLFNSINANVMNVKDKIYINKYINKCMLYVKQEEIVINKDYSLNNTKYSVKDYLNYLKRKQNIFLKKRDCFEKGINIIE